jgi:outer membrane protein assembly factor BamB
MSRAFRLRCLLLVIAFSSVLPFLSGQTRFAVISDTHVGAGGANADLGAVVEAINARQDIDFVVHTGDITEKGRDAEFRKAKEILDRLNIPYFIVPGNHDSHWIGRGLVGYEDSWKTDKFFFVKDGLYCLGLNTWEFGHLASETIDWLAGVVANIPDAASVLVFVHDPPDAVDNWNQVHNLLRKRHAAVIAGHVHKTQVLRAKGGIPAITARASISRGEAQPWGFLIVDASPETIDVREVNGLASPTVLPPLKIDNAAALPELSQKTFANFGAEILWRKDFKSFVLTAPLVFKDSIYMTARSGRMTCLDLRGNVRWSRDFGEQLVGRPALWKNRVYAGTSSGKIVALDTRSGREAVSTDIQERVSSQLAIFQRRMGRPALLVGTGTGRMFCLDAETLATLWIGEGAADLIQTRPLEIAGKILFGSWDARVHALDSESGREVWSWTENDNFYYAPAGCIPASDGTRVFVCSPDSYVSAIDLATGKTSWRAKAASWESLGISPDKKTILVKSRLDEFNVLDSAAGKLVRQTAPAQGNGDLLPVEPLASGGEILFGGQNGNVYLIDKNGRISALFSMGPGGVHSIQSPKRGIFIAADMDGRVVAFRLKRK